MNADQRIKENQYDVDAWTQLIKEHQTKRIEDARDFYESLIETFPLSGRFWKVYVEHEMKFKQYERVEKLFQRCLGRVKHIDVYKCYLNYIKEAKCRLPSFREKMAKAYDFALDHIGIDNQSFSIWHDYVNFLKESEAHGSYAENQKITATRKVYQKGVQNPMEKIEILWKEYWDYEQSINPIIAEKMTRDREKEYMNARRFAKEYEVMCRGLNRNAPATPPSNVPEDQRQVQIWRKYIMWERSNPLKLPEDQPDFIKRVVFAYEQCLLCLGHYPDIWFEYASYLESEAKKLGEKGDVSKKYQEDAAAVYERATTTLLKENILLHFAYADFEESRNKKDKVLMIYNKILEAQSIDPTLVYIQYMRYSRRSEGIKPARNVFKRAREDTRIKHQAYTAAALMEYFCQKDKAVACKIFELGLKKFPASLEFILSYIDFLKNLNEENNTRVLFERVLTTNSLEPEDTLEVWSKFLEFEANIGDLASIHKVELRRSNTVKISGQNRTQTSLLIDRYKFMDLYPSPPEELKAIGYLVKPCGGSVMGTAAGRPEQEHLYSLVKEKAPCKPDVTQMIPFKAMPSNRMRPGSHPVRGGIFPPPPAVGALISILPHPACFKGPFVSVDDLIRIILQNPLISETSTAPKPEGVTNGHRLFETAISASKQRMNSPNINNDGGSSNNSKNQRMNIKREFEEDDEDDNSNSGIPSSSDIYRNRKRHSGPKIMT